MPTDIPGPPHLDAPHPDATRPEVITFLTQYSTNLLGLPRDEALQLARGLFANGRVIYALREKDLEDKYGFAGRVLYHEIQHSRYGLVRTYSHHNHLYNFFLLMQRVSIAIFGATTGLSDWSHLVSSIVSLCFS